MQGGRRARAWTHWGSEVQALCCVISKRNALFLMQSERNVSINISQNTWIVQKLQRSNQPKTLKPHHRSATKLYDTVEIPAYVNCRDWNMQTKLDYNEVEISAKIWWDFISCSSSSGHKWKTKMNNSNGKKSVLLVADGAAVHRLVVWNLNDQSYIHGGLRSEWNFLQRSCVDLNARFKKKNFSYFLQKTAAFVIRRWQLHFYTPLDGRGRKLETFYGNWTISLLRSVRGHPGTFQGRVVAVQPRAEWLTFCITLGYSVAKTDGRLPDKLTHRPPCVVLSTVDTGTDLWSCSCQFHKDFIHVWLTGAWLLPSKFTSTPMIFQKKNKNWTAWNHEDYVHASPLRWQLCVWP